jgi:hypothetical protein
MKKYPNIDFAKMLEDRALESLKAGYYLEAAIVIFQSVEIFLRIAIKGFGDGAGVRSSTLKKCCEDEISFFKLTLYFDLIFPNNKVCGELRELNAKRNRLMHKLFFEFVELDSLNESLKSFCLKGVELQNKLRDLLLSGAAE